MHTVKKGPQIHCWSGWYWLYLKLLKSSVYTFPTALNHTSPLASPLQLYRLLKLHILQLKLSLYFRQFKGPYNFTKQHIKYWKSRVNTKPGKYHWARCWFMKKIGFTCKAIFVWLHCNITCWIDEIQNTPKRLLRTKKMSSIAIFATLWVNVAINKATGALFKQPPHTYPETSMQQ